MTDEELKKRIDDIALAMIDETKKHEETYLNELKEQAFLRLRHLMRQNRF